MRSFFLHIWHKPLRKETVYPLWSITATDIFNLKYGTHVTWCRMNLTKFPCTESVTFTVPRPYAMKLEQSPMRTEKTSTYTKSRNISLLKIMCDVSPESITQEYRIEFKFSAISHTKDMFSELSSEPFTVLLTWTWPIRIIWSYSKFEYFSNRNVLNVTSSSNANKVVVTEDLRDHFQNF